MTEEVKDANVEKEEEVTLTVEELKAEADKLRAEVAKERGIRKKLQTERDTWKKDTTKDDSENFKELYQKQTEELNKLKDKAKNKDIEVAVRAQLAKVGILPDAVEAATRLIDSKLITYDEEAGVDVFGVETAVKDLKSKMKFMFETKIDPSKNRLADSGKGTETKEMSRADFDKLPLHERGKAAREFNIKD